MLPIQDINPTRRFPVVNYALIAINVIVFVTQLGLSEQALTQVYLTQSIVPNLVSQTPFFPETLLDFLRSMFFMAGGRICWGICCTCTSLVTTLRTGWAA